MKESTNQILESDSDLNSNIEDIIKLFDKISHAKTISIEKIDRTLMETIEDANEIKENNNSMQYLFFIIIKNSSVFLILYF